MPTTCVIPGCRSGYRKTKSEKQSVETDEDERITFFKFPEENNSEVRNKWITVVKKLRKDWEHTQYSRICHKHFDSHCFILESTDSNIRRKKSRISNQLSYRRLRPTAVPHLFPSLPFYLSFEVSKPRTNTTSRESRQASAEARQELENERFLREDLFNNLRELSEKLSNELLPSGVILTDAPKRLNLILFEESIEKGLLCLYF
jgi:hypothetical protein